MGSVLCAVAKALVPIGRSIQLDPDCTFPTEAVFDSIPYEIIQRKIDLLFIFFFLCARYRIIYTITI